MPLPKTTIPSERLPRASPSFTERCQLSKEQIEHGFAAKDIKGDVNVLGSFEDIIVKREFNTLFLTGVEGWAYVLLRLPPLSKSQWQNLETAIQQEAIVLEIGGIFAPTYPVLRVVLRVLDHPTKYLIIESFPEVTGGDLQDFIEFLTVYHCWKLLVYVGEERKLVKSPGICIPTTDADWLKTLWAEITRQYYLIDPSERDHQMAVAAVASLFPAGSWEMQETGEPLRIRPQPRQAKSMVVISNRWGLGDGSPLIVPRYPNVPADIKRARSFWHSTAKRFLQRQWDSLHSRTFVPLGKLIGREIISIHTWSKISQKLSPNEEMYLTIAYLEHPDPQVRETMLHILNRGEANARSIGVAGTIIDRLADSSSAIRELAAQVIWKTQSIEYAVKCLRDEYYQRTIYGTEGLTMMPADAVRGLQLLKNAAPTKKDLDRLRDLVKEHLDIDL